MSASTLPSFEINPGSKLTIVEEDNYTSVPHNRASPRGSTTTEQVAIETWPASPDTRRPSTNAVTMPLLAEYEDEELEDKPAPSQQEVAPARSRSGELENSVDQKKMKKWKKEEPLQSTESKVLFTQESEYEAAVMEELEKEIGHLNGEKVHLFEALSDSDMSDVGVESITEHLADTANSGNSKKKEHAIKRTKYPLALKHSSQTLLSSKSEGTKTEQARSTRKKKGGTSESSSSEVDRIPVETQTSDVCLEGNGQGKLTARHLKAVASDTDSLCHPSDDIDPTKSIPEFVQWLVRKAHQFIYSFRNHSKVRSHGVGSDADDTAEETSIEGYSHSFDVGRNLNRTQSEKRNEAVKMYVDKIVESSKAILLKESNASSASTMHGNFHNQLQELLNSVTLQSLEVNGEVLRISLHISNTNLPEQIKRNKDSICQTTEELSQEETAKQTVDMITECREYIKMSKDNIMQIKKDIHKKLNCDKPEKTKKRNASGLSPCLYAGSYYYTGASATTRKLALCKSSNEKQHSHKSCHSSECFDICGHLDGKKKTLCLTPCRKSDCFDPCVVVKKESPARTRIHCLSDSESLARRKKCYSLTDFPICREKPKKLKECSEARQKEQIQKYQPVPASCSPNRRRKRKQKTVFPKGMEKPQQNSMLWNILQTEYREIYSQGRPITDSLEFLKKCQPLTIKMTPLDRYIYSYLYNLRYEEMMEEYNQNKTLTSMAQHYILDPISNLFSF